ncbi:hypothetical protein JG688_00011386, partial [Phytophthora aleatoria]
YLDEHNTFRGTIAKFYPDLPPSQYYGRRVLILKWRRSLHKIVAACSAPKEAKKEKARSQGAATVPPLSVELKLVRWVIDLQDGGVPVTPMMLRLQALEEAKDAGIECFAAGRAFSKLDIA